MKTVKIYVGGEEWTVPRGFGRRYRELARERLDEARDAQLAARGDRAASRRGKRRASPSEIIERLDRQLGLIGYTATSETIANWPLRKRVEAEVYALNVHLRASDNPIPAHPRPKWFPAQAWNGPNPNDDGFDYPHPTEIR